MIGVIKGRAVVLNRHNISTDQIFPGKYINLNDPEEIAKHILEGIDETFKERFRTVGNILVTGDNFGCGSSREQAVIAFKKSGVAAVIANSFGRIFYRNAINLALPVIICPSLAESVVDGEDLEVDFATGTVASKTTGITYNGEPVSRFVLDILEQNGIKQVMRRKYQ